MSIEINKNGIGKMVTVDTTKPLTIEMIENISRNMPKWEPFKTTVYISRTEYLKRQQANL